MLTGRWLLTITLVAVVASCAAPAAPRNAGPSVPPSATVAVATTPTMSPSPSRPLVEVANSALATRVRETGRSAVAICLYVDPAAGVDAAGALVQLQSSIDALVQQGYTALSTRAMPCPQAPLYLRTNTVHPKNSGSGPVGTAPRVTTPSPYILFLTVTTTARIATIFGGLTLRRGTEEITCTGDNCGGVTESIYTDPSAYMNAAIRERLLLEGLGLLSG